MSLRFGPTPWKCSTCGHENPMAVQECENCEREARRTLTDGTQIYPGHRTIIKDGPRAGQQQGYVVLADEERAKGFVRPVRRSYRHLKCGTVTTMGQTLAETYAQSEVLQRNLLLRLWHPLPCRTQRRLRLGWHQ